MDLERVERELKKRLVYPYKWGKKQDNSWDYKTNFIYQTYSVNKLIERTQNFDQALTDYAFNRWYNFWSAMAVENIFCSENNVFANKNKFDKLVDFTINDIPFDHKTSIYPRGFNKSIDYAKQNEQELINWLYQNQSQQGRKHLKNRLFIVLYDGQTHQHWKMKSDIMLLKTKIDEYISSFNKSNLFEFDFGDGEVLSDIIWIER